MHTPIDPPPLPPHQPDVVGRRVDHAGLEGGGGEVLDAGGAAVQGLREQQVAGCTYRHQRGCGAGF